MIDLLAKYSSTWNGHLCIIANVQHNIEVEDGPEPFRPISYRAGISLCEIEKAEVHKILYDGVKIPAPPTNGQHHQF